jgi:hypothetical protein
MTHIKRLIALALAGVGSNPLMASELDWHISEASGNVQLLHAGLSKVAVRGGAVQPGDTIVTGRGSRAVVTRGEEYLMVAASSQLRLPATEQSGVVTKIFQDFGNVVFMIKKKMTPHFAVSTPYLAAVVKGTTFSVSVTQAGTSVQVLEGAVDVATADGGAHDLLKPGAVAMVNATDRFRLRIEGDGPARTIASPAIAPNDRSTQPGPVDAPAAVSQPAAASEGVAGEDVIPIAIAEKPVSLAGATGGLVNGTVGGDIQAQFAIATESSRAAADTIQAATASAAASRVAEEASAARAEASVVSANAAEAAKAAEQASSAAARSSEAAASAADAKAASEAAAAAATAQAAQAAEQARAAAAESARAADEVAARQAKEAAATAAALEAQRAVEAAKANAADASTLERATKAAADAAEEAHRAADAAAQAEADRLAREAARSEAESQAAKTAKEAAQAAQDAQAKAADQAARAAAKAADDAAKERATQLANAAAEAEKSAKEAADKAGKQAEMAATEAQRAVNDAVKVADAKHSGTDLGDPGPSSGNGSGRQGDKGGNGQGGSGTGSPLDTLSDVLTTVGKPPKGKN